MKRHRTLLLTLLFYACPSLALPSAAEAQTCFPPRPAPECDTFWLTQLGVGAFTTDLGELNQRQFLSADVGIFKNLDPMNAIGMAGFVVTGGIDGWGGVEGRYRRWIRGDVSLDVGLGVAPFTGSSLESPVFKGDVGLSGDVVGIFFQLQNFRQCEPRGDACGESQVVPGISGRLGGTWGAYALAAVTALGLFAWMVLASP